METGSRSVQLCIKGTKAEFERRIADAQRLYREAWEAAVDDYDAAVAAHYIAHLETSPADALRWNLIALDRARRDERAEEFMGALLVSVGGAYEATGDVAQAEHHFQLAAQRGVQHFRG